MAGSKSVEDESLAGGNKLASDLLTAAATGVVSSVSTGILVGTVVCQQGSRSRMASAVPKAIVVGVMNGNVQ